MEGLVINPFDEGLDARLREIDPAIPLPEETAKDCIARVLKGEYQPRGFRQAEDALPKGFITYAPVKRLLIHARGATAVRATALEAAGRGTTPTHDSLHEASQSVLEIVDPIDDPRGSAGYKRDMSAVFARRAMEQVLGVGG